MWTKITDLCVWADTHCKLETDLSENKFYLWREVLPDFTDFFLETVLCNVAVLKSSVKRIHLVSVCLLAGNGLNNFPSSPTFISSETAGGERSSPQPPFLFSTLLLQWNNRFQELIGLLNKKKDSNILKRKSVHKGCGYKLNWWQLHIFNKMITYNFI